MRPEKVAIAKELEDHLSQSEYCILTAYQGLTVEKSEDLRTKLHQTSARMLIVKNRVLAVVAEKQGLQDLVPELSGPTAMIFGTGDVVGTAKVLKEFVKENELPVVKVGTYEGKVISAGEIGDLADLPSREELLAKVVGTLAAPLSQVVGVLHQKVSSLVYVVDAVRAKREAEG